MPGEISGVLRLASLQRTRPLIISALMGAGWRDDSQKALQLVQRTAATHIEQSHTIAAVVTELRKAGIEPVLLKGLGLARNYPEPLLRKCGDIDLYVGKENYDKACEVVMGMTSEEAIKNSIKSTKHLHISVGGFKVELHRVSEEIADRRHNDVYQAIADNGLSQDLVPLNFDGTTVNTPADSFNAFFIFHHFLHHFFSGGIGLRQVCDWVMFLHSRAGKLDTSVAEDALKGMNLLSFWQTFACIAVDYLGLPAAEMPFYRAGMEREAAGALGLILAEGNFGMGRKDRQNRPQGYLAGKLYSFRMTIRRYIALCRIFPRERRAIFAKIIRFTLHGSGRVIKDLRR